MEAEISEISTHNLWDRVYAVSKQCVVYYETYLYSFESPNFYSKSSEILLTMIIHQ